jgi:hypothetical protein
MLKKILISIFCIATVQTGLEASASSNQNRENNRRNRQLQLNDGSPVIQEGRFTGLTEREADLILSNELARQREDALQRGRQAGRAAIAGTTPVPPPLSTAAGIAPVAPFFGNQNQAQLVACQIDFN